MDKMKTESIERIERTADGVRIERIERVEIETGATINRREMAHRLAEAAVNGAVAAVTAGGVAGLLSTDELDKPVQLSIKARAGTPRASFDLTAVPPPQVRTGRVSIKSGVPTIKVRGVRIPPSAA